MDSVARRARLSRALVYVYFKDKRDLHFGIAARAMQTLLTRFEEASSRSRSGLDKVVAIGRAYMAYGQEFPHYFDACARLELHAPDAEDGSPQESMPLEIGQQCTPLSRKRSPSACVTAPFVTTSAISLSLRGCCGVSRMA